MLTEITAAPFDRPVRKPPKAINLGGCSPQQPPLYGVKKPSEQSATSDAYRSETPNCNAMGWATSTTQHLNHGCVTITLTAQEIRARLEWHMQPRKRKQTSTSKDANVPVSTDGPQRTRASYWSSQEEQQCFIEVPSRSKPGHIAKTGTLATLEGCC